MKKVKVIMLFALCMGILATPCAACADTCTFAIPSTQPWTNTNIWVEAGDTIEIWASGSIKWADPGLWATPDGMPGTSSDLRYVVTDPSIPQNSLIGNIALSTSFADGAGFFVGSYFLGAVPISGARLTEGYLYLGHNDGAIYTDRSGYNSYGFTGDNYGSWTVEVVHTKGDVVPEPASILLFGSAMAGFAAYRRRRRKK